MLTPKIICYIGSEEGLVPEAYLDSKNIWTWAMGVAETGGHSIQQFKDNPQPLGVCLNASIDLIKKQYLPPVLKAFPGKTLTETQLAAALSFHWRTGRIAYAQWVQDYNEDKIDFAEAEIMNWTDHGKEKARTEREQALFFKHQWPVNMMIPIYRVSKPSYHPYDPHLADLSKIIEGIMNA